MNSIDRRTAIVGAGAAAVVLAGSFEQARAQEARQGTGSAGKSDNIATVKTIYAAFGKGDVPGILAHLHPDVEWEHDWGGATLKWYQPRRGRSEVPKFFQSLADFEFVRFEPVAFLAGDNLVAVPIHLEVVVKANNKRIRDLEAHLWTFDAGGLVTRMRHILDTHQFATATATS